MRDFLCVTSFCVPTRTVPGIRTPGRPAVCEQETLAAVLRLASCNDVRGMELTSQNALISANNVLVVLTGVLKHVRLCRWEE
jgi:hypothetical protein